MGDTEDKVKQIEEQKALLESEKNREITNLKERIAELMFTKTLFPVTEQLSQTPFSKKFLDSQRAASQCDASQPQPTEPDVSQPDPFSQHVAGSGQQMIAMEIQSGLSSLMNLVGQLSPSAKTFTPNGNGNGNGVGCNNDQTDAVVGNNLLTPMRPTNTTTYSEEDVQALRNQLALAKEEAEEAKKRENQMAVQWNLTATKYANEEKARKKLEGELKEEQKKVVVVQRKSLEMKRSADEKDAAIEEAHKDVDELKKDLLDQQEKFRQEADSNFKEISELRTQHEGQLEQLRNEKSASLDELTATLRLVTELKEQLADAYHTKEGSMKKLSRTEEKLETCTEQISDLENDKKEISEALKVKKQELADAKKEVTSLKREKTQLTAQVKKAEKRSEQLEKKTAARGQVEELKQELESKDEELESALTDNKKLESQIKLLKKEVEDLRVASEVKQMAINIGKIKRGKKEQDDEALGEADEVTNGKKRKTHPHVILSGFREKRQISKEISSLGGTLLKTVGDNWDNRCTHMVIASHDVRTMKTIAAALTHKWVMPKMWVTDSIKAGKWLDEQKYGYLLKHDGVVGKSVHMTDAFCLVGGSDRIRTGTQLVELGKGKITESMDAADIVLRAPVDGNHFQNGDDHMTFTWEGFISWIFPTTWKPPISLSPES